MHVAAMPLLILSAVPASQAKTDKPLATIDEGSDRVSFRVFEQEQKYPRVYTGVADLSEKDLDYVKREVRSYNSKPQIAKNLRAEVSRLRVELAAFDDPKFTERMQQRVGRLEAVAQQVDESIKKLPERLHKRLLNAGLRQITPPPTELTSDKSD